MSLFLFFFLMIRRPPRSTLFPYTTPSDLQALEEPGRAREVHADDSRPAAHQLGGGRQTDARCGSGHEDPEPGEPRDRKSTRLNSSHANISYAVFCLKKQK